MTETVRRAVTVKLRSGKSLHGSIQVPADEYAHFFDLIVAGTTYLIPWSFVEYVQDDDQ